MELLAAFKTDLDAGDAKGKTALHWASKEGHLAVVQFRVKVGADTEAKNQDGETSLHTASFSGHLAVVQTLVNHGADVATETNYGRTALGVARNEEVKAALREREPL